MMFLWARKGVVFGVCVVILCLLMSLYATRRQCYCEQQVEYIAVAAAGGDNVEITPARSNVTPSETSERPYTPPQHRASTQTRTQVVSASDNEWNVFDSQSSETYTLIVQTYKRNDLLKRFLKHYNHSSFPLLEKILVIWNNIDVPLEPAMFQEEISLAAVPVEFIVSKVNSMRNKLKPYPQIQTAAVLVIDDDLLIAAPDVDFAFQVWQQFPHRIIGFSPRKHVLKPNGTIDYGFISQKTGVPNSYSMVLTCSTFLHKGYLKMFNETIHPEINEMIERTMNCDDLAINVMVGDYLARIGMPQPSGVYVEAKTSIQDMAFQAKSGFYGVSAQPDHFTERAYCLKKLNDTYHGLPLPFTSLVASKLMN